VDIAADIPLQQQYTDTISAYSAFDSTLDVVHILALQRNTTTFVERQKQAERHTATAVPPG
jgi:hypothetical protein